MSAGILFISDQILKDKSVLSDNVEGKFISPVIKKAQDKELEPVLGSALFLDLQDKIQSQTLSIDEKFLLKNYIVDVMVYAYLVHSQIELTYRMQNKGTHKKEGNDTEGVSLQEIQGLINYYKDDMEFYKNKLIKYLQANSDKYPKYLDPNNGVDKNAPIKKAWKSPINLKPNTI